MIAQPAPWTGVAPDVAGAHPGDDLAAPSAGVGEQRLEFLDVHRIGLHRSVGGEIVLGLLEEEAARPPVPRAPQRLIEAADRLRFPQLGNSDQVELQLKLRLLLELLRAG